MTQAIKRLPDWTARLNRVVDANRFETFTWDSHNCCLWVCNALREMTGVDVAFGFRSKCTSAKRVRQLLKDAGGVAQLAADVLPKYGMVQVTPQMAKRGDVLIADTAAGPAAGVCVGAMGAFPAADGLVFINVSSCLTAWSF